MKPIDLPPMPVVIVLAPSYRLANDWARKRGIFRRRVHPIVGVTELNAQHGPVQLVWPDGHPDPEYVVETYWDLVRTGQIHPLQESP